MPRQTLFTLVLWSVVASAATDLWLARVSPILSKEERQLYLSLRDGKAQEAFRRSFFEGKAITETEYMARITHIDAVYGGDQPGSGANTDPGRLYLALGPPTGIQRLPSSRVLYPNEIWYYDHVPGLQTRSRLQFLLFKPRDLGTWKLYSPQIDTLRALIVNNAGTRGMFPINDIITEGDVLNKLKLSPGELDVLDAALSVAKGVKGSGNSEIIYLASNPREMLSRQRSTAVRSSIRYSQERPKFTFDQFVTPNRIPAVDLRAEVKARSSIRLEIREDAATEGDSFETKIDFPDARALDYRHRLFLLPGDYTVLLDVDGFRTGYALHVDKVKPTDAPAPEWANATEKSTLAYRANLYPGSDWNAVGKQYMSRSQWPQAATCFTNGLAAARSLDALLGVARVEAATGRLDASRSLLEELLRREPRHYEALVTLAAVTAEFQDYPLAAKYYEQALALRESPLLRQALDLVKNKK